MQIFTSQAEVQFCRVIYNLQHGKQIVEISHLLGEIILKLQKSNGIGNGRGFKESETNLKLINQLENIKEECTTHSSYITELWNPSDPDYLTISKSSSTDQTDDYVGTDTEK